jgi:hypothetical protein
MNRDRKSLREMDLSFFGAELGFGQWTYIFRGRIHSSLGEFESRNEPNYSIISAWSVVVSDPIGYETFNRI